MPVERAHGSAVDISVRDSFVLARLCIPPANPIGPVLLDGLAAAADAVEEHRAGALVIWSSVTGFFAAGADIKHMHSLGATGFAAYGEQMRQVYDRIENLSAVSIAAIEGIALGGGLELALACTLRIGSTDARLGLPEVKLGLIPGAGGTQRLPRLVGRSRALDLLLTGRQVAGDEAHNIGLLDRLVAPGAALKSACEIAHQLGTSSAPALAAIHRCVDVATTSSLADGIAFEAAEEQLLFEEGDAREGIAAFVERRPPTFRLLGRDQQNGQSDD
jgi:enoyl-CoA hydratase/carnithine racemase